MGHVRANYQCALWLWLLPRVSSPRKAHWLQPHTGFRNTLNQPLAILSFQDLSPSLGKNTSSCQVPLLSPNNTKVERDVKSASAAQVVSPKDLTLCLPAAPLQHSSPDSTDYTSAAVSPCELFALLVDFHFTALKLV